MSKDGVVGLLMAVFGLVTVFVLIPTQISRVPPAILATGVSPRVFPLVGAWGVFGFGALVLLQNIVAKRRGRLATAGDSSKKMSSDVFGVTVFFLAIVSYVVLLPVLGHFIATPIAIAGYMLLLGERSILRILVTLGLTTILISLFFRLLLNTVLPTGVLF